MPKKFASKSLMSTLDEKIFFVIKFWIISAVQGLALIIIVFFIGMINALQLLLLGIVLFVVSLVLSRRFDGVISKIALKITKKLNYYPKIRKALLKSI